ncbi:MAG: pectate lyase, partial [Prevotellaceae bacterium]|nr:pectate lyase [Prevotellaceae bacterium]
MKHIYLLLLAAILAVFSAACGSDKQPEEEEQPPVTPAEVVAFPGAEGFGRLTTGGRGGKVLYVTTLSDSDTLGSLRWAVNQTGKRTIIFKVAGNIVLSSRLSIKNGDVTIAGQSAPGAGICISGHEVVVAASNVIIRYLRFRMGDATKVQGDAFGGYNQKNIIIDHCSMSWGTDEVSSWYENENFTMQWCLLAESLRVSVHVKGPHGLTGIWGGHKASFHHNMIAHSDDRNPRFCGSLYSNRPDEELVDFRNNVIYNWGSNSGYGGEGGSYNMVNNYYQPGEGSGSKTRIFAPNPDNGANIQQAGVWGTFYVAGNLMMNANGTVNTSVTADNWEGIHPKNGKNKNELKSATEFEKGEVTTHTAQEAYDLVLAKVGASLKRDNT